MRFLLGLMMGAAMVLVLTEGLTGGGDWRGRLTAAVAGFDAWLHDEPAVPPTGPRDAPMPAEAPSRTPETDSLAPAIASSAPSEPAGQPIPPPSEPQPSTALVLERPGPGMAGLSDSSKVVAVAAGASAPPVALPPARAQEPPQAPHPVMQPNLQTVWFPFHSEMSASGFAGRLTESLDHPFRVERLGPGRYQVVFPYADESQREVLLSRAAEATGLPL